MTAETEETQLFKHYQYIYIYIRPLDRLYSKPYLFTVFTSVAVQRVMLQ